MSSNGRIVKFVVVSCLLYLFFSIVSVLLNNQWFVWQRVNLIGDIVQKKSNETAGHSNDIETDMILSKNSGKDISIYNYAHLIINFSKDTSEVALSGLMKKLRELKQGTKRKIRIAYFGDSVIEGDLLTQTLRKLFQEQFGGCGVGFIPVSCISSKFRQTATTRISDDWEEENFKAKKLKNALFLSGYSFSGDNQWLEVTDNTISQDSTTIEKSLFYGNSPYTTTILANNQPITIPAGQAFGKQVVCKGTENHVKINATKKHLPVYGVSFESSYGVILDNFSFRGISGIELNNLDTQMLKAVNLENSYDLIILQYGVNVMFRPGDKNFSWYGNSLIPVINKIKKYAPGTEIIVVSTTDRAFRYNGTYSSAIGIDSLVKVQAMIAYETGSCFYNQFQTMGGRNSIVNWANSNPPLAGKDYIHPNAQGAAVLARNFFNILMKDYYKYEKTAEIKK